MNDHFKRQAEQFMNAAKDARIPEQFQVFAEESVTKSREAFDQIAAAAKGQARVAEDMVLATQAGAKVIGSKLIENTVANTEAAFDAAHAITRAKSVAEAMRLQAEFAQKQFAAAGMQTKELFELSSRVARQAFEMANTAAATPGEQPKKQR